MVIISSSAPREEVSLIRDLLIESNQIINTIHFIQINSSDNIRIIIANKYSSHILVKKAKLIRNKIFNLIKFKAITLIRDNTPAKNKLDRVINISNPTIMTKEMNKK
jgi:hypothetical protein